MFAHTNFTKIIESMNDDEKFHDTCLESIVRSTHQTHIWKFFFFFGYSNKIVFHYYTTLANGGQFKFAFLKLHWPFCDPV